ncbi:MAG TPA: TIGR04211 family SH3 domain-containing protein [Woeseiaceae bacterium]|nr:TIGR04211 family SH3 domain-containing protein [Woeseiaceae bacterium]
MLRKFTGLIACCLALAPLAALAAPAWVTDQFEITLRSGPSTSNAIQLMLKSGAQIEVLERDADSGYSLVRTSGGTEGWVLTRYLMPEPSAREQLNKLTSQLTNAQTEGSSLNSQLGAVRSEYDSAQKKIKTLESQKSALEKELAEIKSTAANVLTINEQNKSLRQKLVDADIRIDTLEEENRGLSGQTKRYWFMSGALVLVIGIILGLWLPRIRWQKRSRYDRF